MKNLKIKLGTIIFVMSIFVVQMTSMVMASTYTMTDNNSFDNAYNAGGWNSSNTYTKTFPAYDSSVPPADDQSSENWIKFNAKAGDRVGIKITYASLGSYEDLSDFTVTLSDASNKTLKTSSAIYSNNTSVRFKYVYYEFEKAGTYYVSMIRNEGLDKLDVGGISFFDPIKSGSGTYTFSGTASNTGNPIGNVNGTYSSILTLDLKNQSAIPADARLKSVTTSSTMSPSQGNVRHNLYIDGYDWAEAKANSATSGSYYLTVSDKVPARGVYKFKYKALASAPSNMTNVKVNMTYEYNDIFNYKPSN